MQTAPWMVLGLWVLGFLNVLAGIGALTADYQIGSIPIIIGIASIELGSILLGYWNRETGPNWDIHALRIAVEVFVLGLMVTSL